MYLLQNLNILRRNCRRNPYHYICRQGQTRWQLPARSRRHQVCHLWWMCRRCCQSLPPGPHPHTAILCKQDSSYWHMDAIWSLLSLMTVSCSVLSSVTVVIPAECATTCGLSYSQINRKFRNLHCVYGLGSDALKNHRERRQLYWPTCAVHQIRNS